MGVLRQRYAFVLAAAGLWRVVRAFWTVDIEESARVGNARNGESKQMITKNKNRFSYTSQCGNVSLTAYDYADFMKKIEALKKDVENEFNPRTSQELTKTEKIKLMGKFAKKTTSVQSILRSLYFNNELKELVFTNGYIMLICSHDEGESRNVFYHVETAAKGVLVEDTAIEGKYPNYSKILMPESGFKYELQIDIPGWKALCKKLECYAKEHMSVRVWQGNIYETSGDKSILFEGFCAPFEEYIQFNPEYLAKALYFLSGRCRMGVTDIQKGVMLKREKDAVMLMPIKD